MVDPRIIPDREEVGDQVFEELMFKFLAKKYSVSKEEIIKLANQKNNI